MRLNAHRNYNDSERIKGFDGKVPPIVAFELHTFVPISTTLVDSKGHRASRKLKLNVVFFI